MVILRKRSPRIYTFLFCTELRPQVQCHGPRGVQVSAAKSSCKKFTDQGEVAKEGCQGNGGS